MDIVGGLCDLHTHSTFSDGTLTPTELIKAAISEGLSAIALCDHNTLAGIPEFTSAAGKNIFAVPGIEISTEYKGTELHVLGLFVGEAEADELTSFLADLHLQKELANLSLFKRLKDAGYDLIYENIFSQENKVINRVHFAKELMRLGVISAPEEGFKGILSAKNGFYVPPKRPDVFETVSLLKRLKVVSSLAHPLLNLSFSELSEFIPKAAKAGLVAIESDYTKFDADTTKRLRRLAGEHGLLLSGGSDFHGENKPDNLLGRGYGDLAVPMAYYHSLKSVSLGYEK